MPCPPFTRRLIPHLGFALVLFCSTIALVGCGATESLEASPDAGERGDAAAGDSGLSDSGAVGDAGIVDSVRLLYSPQTGEVPLPNDLFRDEVAGSLAIPVERLGGVSEAARDFYSSLNSLDGWPTTLGVSFAFSAPVRADSIRSSTVEVWRWADEPTRLADVEVELNAAGTRGSMKPPLEGWRRATTYLGWVRSGAEGVRGSDGEPIGCDATFCLLRSLAPLNEGGGDPRIPAGSAAERQRIADALEAHRLSLQPYFEWLETRGVSREEVAALWSFTTTDRTELCIDPSSQRMPLPIELLRDPSTGRIDIPVLESDDDVERAAKERLADYDGFALSADLSFELTRPVDPATVTEENILVFELDGRRRRLEAELSVVEDRYVLIRPRDLPFEPGARYAVVVRDGLRDRDGGVVEAMPIGRLLLGSDEVSSGGSSMIPGIDDAGAARIEATREPLQLLLSLRGREGVITAYSFTTMTVQDRLRDLLDTSESLSLDPTPSVTAERSVLGALIDFPLAIGSTGLSVARVIEGTIPGADFLDPRTRGWTETGEAASYDLPFTMTLPRWTDGPVPVVIFAHAIMTERRFLLAVGNALAREGFAAVAIDLPYHGTRSYCFDGGPISVPDPTTGELRSFAPCPARSTCGDEGRCVDRDGREVDFNRWPVLGYPVTSGAAFFEFENIPNTTDHFDQALVDLGTLLRSLRSGTWNAALETTLRTDEVFVVGQSLGAIIAATFCAVAPDVERFVLNVPGADLVDMLRESAWFGPHVDAYFRRESLDPSSYEAARFFNVARWIVDRVDPQSVARSYRSMSSSGLIQMALADFIIPNQATRTLETLSGLPRRDYLGEHAFLVIPVEPAYLRGTIEMANFLSGDLSP